MMVKSASRKPLQKKLRILFVCGRNQWRSPTAERTYRNDPRVEARSAGVSDKSRHTISRTDIEWANLILVMESGYKNWIASRFRDVPPPKIVDLDIPDEYEYMDEELIQLIKQGVEFFLQG